MPGSSLRGWAAVERRLAARFRAQAAQFEALARRVRLRLAPDDIHDLRVLTRRMRAAAWIGDQAGGDTVFGRLRRGLRRLGRVLGRRRAADVAAGDAVRYRLDPAALEGPRDRAGRKLLRALSRKEGRALVEDLRAAARGFGALQARPLQAALARRAAELRRAAREAPSGKEALHRLRIEARKARYTLEALGRGGAFLKPLQDHLGRGHDLETLQKFTRPGGKAARDERRRVALALRRVRRDVDLAALRLTRPLPASR